MPLSTEIPAPVKAVRCFAARMREAAVFTLAEVSVVPIGWEQFRDRRSSVNRFCCSALIPMVRLTQGGAARTFLLDEGLRQRDAR
jgi:hypothetical protein